MHICNLRMWFFQPLYVMQAHSVKGNLINGTSGTHARGKEYQKKFNNKDLTYFKVSNGLSFCFFFFFFLRSVHLTFTQFRFYSADFSFVS